MKWLQNQLVWITSDLSLGPARIIEDDLEDFFVVRFLKDQSTRRFSKKHPPFRRLEFRVDQKIVFTDEIEHALTKVELRSGLYEFETTGGAFGEADIEEIPQSLGVLDLLEHQHFTDLRAFRMRLAAWNFRAIVKNSPMKGIAGCRVEILEHQLQVADSCLKMPCVRAFLCDEVGLGKTIEAGLVLSAMMVREKLSRVLVVVPEALKVQWLTELYRRFNIRFRLDHEDMIETDDFRDFVITSFEKLQGNEEPADLVIVDEAHRFLESEHSGLAHTILTRSRHALLLSATPLLRGSEGLKNLVDLLRTPTTPEPRVFRSKREDLKLRSWRQVEPVFVESRENWIENFIGEKITQGKREKVFLITSQEEAVLKLSQQLVRRFGTRFALFHEGMDLVERDRQAAYFSDPEGAQFLISSEIGGEGRNFQFCSEMILVDLPEDPAVLEQRIGRLDRIGQKQNVRICCPVVAGSRDEFLFEVHRDVFEVFQNPWTGASLRDSANFSRHFQEALNEQSRPKIESLKEELNGSRQDLRTFQKELGFRLMAFDPNNESLGNEVRKITDQDIRPFLEELYDYFGVEVEDFDTRGNLKISASSLMFVDYFPGLGADGEKVLTFNRALALAREDFTYFTVDHPEFAESLDLLLSSDNGRLALAKSETHAKELFFVALLLNPKLPEAYEVRAFSYSTGQEILGSQKLVDSSIQLPADRLPPPFLARLNDEFRNFFMKNISKKMNSDSELDGLLIIVPS
jgi:ATP-dependent helicase HepA